MNDRPIGPPYEQLTEAQRICLRHVFQHKTSKQIALLLGISKFTVDQRIERACRTLGAESRVQAALLLAEHESPRTPDRIVYDPVDIADPASTEASGIPPAASRPEDELEIAQVQATYRPSRDSAGSLWDVAVPRGNADDLTPVARIKWIVQLTMMIVIVILILLVIAQGLSGVAERTWPSHSLLNS